MGISGATKANQGLANGRFLGKKVRTTPIPRPPFFDKPQNYLPVPLRRAILFLRAILNKHFYGNPPHFLHSLFAFLLLPFSLKSQPNFTANQTVAPYSGGFHPAANNGYSPVSRMKFWRNGPKTPAPPCASRDVGGSRRAFGNEILINLFEHYKNLGMGDHTFIVQNQMDWHRDSSLYCPDQHANFSRMPTSDLGRRRERHTI